MRKKKMNLKGRIEIIINSRLTRVDLENILVFSYDLSVDSNDAN